MRFHAILKTYLFWFKLDGPCWPRRSGVRLLNEVRRERFKISLVYCESLGYVASTPLKGDQTTNSVVERQQSSSSSRPGFEMWSRVHSPYLGRWPPILRKLWWNTTSSAQIVKHKFYDDCDDTSWLCYNIHILYSILWWYILSQLSYNTLW